MILFHEAVATILTLVIFPLTVSSGFSQPPPLTFHSTSSTRTQLGLSAPVDAATKECYQHVFIAGASRGVGRHTVNALREAYPETKITALVRSTESADELGTLDDVTVVVGDALDYKTVESAMDECGADAVISTLGRSTNDVDTDAPRVDYTGNNHVIEAAGILGVTRVVLVTSVGCGDSKDAIPESAYEVLKEALQAKTKAESVLTKYYTNTNWTIIRPGGLKSEPKTGTAILTTDNDVAGAIHREDLADLIVRSLTSSNTMRQILTAVDLDLLGPERKSSVSQFQL